MTKQRMKLKQLAHTSPLEQTKIDSLFSLFNKIELQYTEKERLTAKPSKKKSHLYQQMQEIQVMGLGEQVKKPAIKLNYYRNRKKNSKWIPGMGERKLKISMRQPSSSLFIWES